MSETVEYIPQAGDVVTFPAALMEVNRTIRYVITSVGRRVAYRPEGRDGLGPYLNTLDELRELGIQKAAGPVIKEARP